MKKIVFFPVIVGLMILLGAGCASTDYETAEVDLFEGMDGELTEMAFEDVAEGFIEYLTVSEIDNPDQDIYDVWVEFREDVYPVNDSFENVIQVYSDLDNTFVLWSAGEDGLEDTEDDYIKAYSY